MAGPGCLIKPNLNKDYPVISYGKGIYLYDVDNKKYIDGSSGAITNAIGHGVEEVANASSEQMARISFVHRGHFTNEPAEHLAKKIATLSPGELKWSFFVNSGSEATETAMKLAIQYWQEAGHRHKNRVISRWMSYHGMTNGALSMSGHVLRRERFPSILQPLPMVSSPYPFRSNYRGTDSQIAESYAAEVDQAITNIGAENVAAFIAEPIVGAAGGAVVPPIEYFPRIREICDKHNVLLIVDEVMTGFGRTGKWFASNHWGITPDIMTLGKGMSAGYTPIAATLASDTIIKTIRAGSGVIIGGHTYSANPLSCAIALEVLEYIDSHGLIHNASEQGTYLLSQLRQLQLESQFIGDARGIGLMCGIEFVTDKVSNKPFPLSRGITDQVVQACMDHGLIVYPAVGGIDGKAGDAIMIAPPLTITRSQVDELIEKLRAAVFFVERGLQSGMNPSPQKN